MTLRELVNQSHQLKTQLKQLEQEKASLASSIHNIEKEIKTLLDEAGHDYDNLSEAEFQLLMEDLGDPLQLNVEIVYAHNKTQIIREVQLPKNATIDDAIALSGILELCEEIDLAKNKVGIYGFIKPLSTVLADGDRVEIYRPVTATK